MHGGSTNKRMRRKKRNRLKIWRFKRLKIREVEHLNIARSTRTILRVLYVIRVAKSNKYSLLLQMNSKIWNKQLSALFERGIALETAKILKIIQIELLWK